MDNKPTTSISMGLDAIFAINSSSTSEKKSSGVAQITLSHIFPSPFQARKQFSESAIAELAASIAEHGLLQPIIVRQVDHNQYELLAGERRLRALALLNQSTVPAIICEATDEIAMAFGVIENIQRENLNPIEEAAAYDRLLNEFQLSHDQLAKRMGKSRSHMTNMLRLYRLPDAVKQCVIDDALSMGHARAILMLSAEDQIVVAQRVIERGMSVRQTEEYVKLWINNPEKMHDTKPFLISPELKHVISSWKTALHNKYAADIKIALNPQGRGRVVLEVSSVDELS